MIINRMGRIPASGVSVCGPSMSSHGMTYNVQGKPVFCAKNVLDKAVIKRPSTQHQNENLEIEGGGTYLRSKDSKAEVGVYDRAIEKALEGTDRQTDKQTSAHYKKMC